jgi:hypothetical protein
MTAIAEHLDRKLKAMPPAAAASVEKLVWDLLSVVELAPMSPHAQQISAAQDREAAVKAHQEHWKKVDAMTKELDWSEFERPPQGEFEVREDW